MTATTSNDLRAALRAHMDEHGISIAALAREAKCPAPNVSNWLAGKKDVTLETAVRIFAAAGMPLRVDGA